MMMTDYNTKDIKIQVISHESGEPWPVGIKSYVPIFKGICAKCGEDYNKHGVRYDTIYCPDDIIVKYRSKILAIDPDIFSVFFMEAKT